MINIFLIQIFWLSFAVIGFALLLGAHRSRRKGFVSESFWDFFVSNKITLAVISFVTGVGFFVLPVCLAYIFEWQVWYLSALYLALLTISVAALYRERVLLKRHLRIEREKFDRASLLRIVLVGFALSLDYAISIRTGGNLAGDVPLHLSKIQLFANGHFTLADPFMGYNGVLDLRYSANLMNALQAVITNLLHISATTVWFYSFAFYRLIIWGCLFVLAKALLPARTPKNWPYIVLVLCPFIYTGYFFYSAELPHAIALAWTALLFVGVKLFLKENSIYLLILSSILIATTHAITSFVTFLYLLSLIVILVLVKKITRRQIVALLIAASIVLIPVVANAMSPSRSTDKANLETFATGLHASTSIATKQFGSVTLPELNPARNPRSRDLFDWHFVAMALLLMPYVFVLKKIRPSMRRSVIYVITLAALAVFNPLYVSILGAVYLLYKTPDIRLKLFVSLAMIFFALFAYNPIFLTLVQGHIPLWFVARFQDFNTIAYITPIVGILAGYQLLTRYAGLPKMANGYSILLLIFIATIAPLHQLPIDFGRLLSLDRDNYTVNKLEYNKVRKLERLDPYLKNQVVFSNDVDFTRTFGMVTQSTNLGLLVNEQSNQSQNYNQRAACQVRLFKYMHPEDLRAAGITRLVLVTGGDNGLPDGKDYHHLPLGQQPYFYAGQLPYLRFLEQVGHDRIYEVVQDKLPQTGAGACAISRGQ